MRIKEPQSFNESCSGTSTIINLFPAQDVLFHPASVARPFFWTKKTRTKHAKKNSGNEDCQEEHSDRECLEADSAKECREAYLDGEWQEEHPDREWQEEQSAGEWQEEQFSRGVAGRISSRGVAPRYPDGERKQTLPGFSLRRSTFPSQVGGLLLSSPLQLRNARETWWCGWSLAPPLQAGKCGSLSMRLSPTKKNITTPGATPSKR
jgi:hypothetical protein